MEIAFGIFVLVVLFSIFSYNGLIKKQNQFKNAFSQIDVQLQRRYDLIPNLVETAKAYMSHERDTLEAVMAARNQAQSAAGLASKNPADVAAMQGLIGAESGLAGAMGRLFAVVENYPNLKADQTMAHLMEELTSTENRVGFARQAFNDSVMSYNTAREVFPSNIISGMFGFQAAQAFEITKAETREAPKVSFGK